MMPRSSPDENPRLSSLYGETLKPPNLVLCAATMLRGLNISGISKIKLFLDDQLLGF